MKTIGIIGGGVMGEVFVSHFLKREVFSIDQIFLSDKNFSKRNFFEEKYRIRTFSSNKEICKKSDIIFLCIKPQQFNVMVEDIQEDLQGKIVISIMAGVSIKKLSKMKDAKIVRVMPNTPSQIGEGVIGIIFAGSFTEKDKKDIISYLEILGKVFVFHNEENIDVLTAVSGSGPAYIFYFAEIIEQACRDFGFDTMVSREIVRQLFLGSSKLLCTSEKNFSELRKQVTSKGGTTEAALSSLDQDGFSEIVTHAIKSAYKRAKEL